MLQQWLNENVDYPYASRSTRSKLARQANLTPYQVSAWLHAQRKKFNKENKHYENKIKKFTREARHYLNDYFTNINKRPGPLDIQILAEQLNQPEKRINNWFTMRRFREPRTNRSFKNHSAQSTFEFDFGLSEKSLREPSERENNDLARAEANENVKSVDLEPVVVLTRIKLPTTARQELIVEQKESVEERSCEIVQAKTQENNATTAKSIIQLQFS